MHSKHLSLVIDIRESTAKALERLAHKADAADRGSLGAARRLAGLGRDAHGNGDGLGQALTSIERMHRAFTDMGTTAAPAGAGLERVRSLLADLRHKSERREATAFQAAHLPAFAGGGVLFRRPPAPLITNGAGSVDDVPALLMRGEYVVRRSAVDKYGLRLLEALNQGRLPIDLIPRFAMGGLVLPPRVLDLAPRFAEGGTVGVFRSGLQGGAASGSGSGPSGYFATLASLDPGQLIRQFGGLTESELRNDMEKRVAGLLQRVKLEQLRKTPEKYLSNALGQVTDSLKVFQSMELTDPPTARKALSGASAELAAQAAALNDEYKSRIAMAREEGDEQLATLLETQRLELEAVIEDLRAALEDLLYDYLDGIESLAEKTSAEASKLNEKYSSEAEKAAADLAAMGSYGAISGHRILSTARGSKERRLADVERKAMLAAKRLERSLERGMQKQQRDHSRLANATEREFRLEGLTAETAGRLDLRSTFGDYKRSIQDLEIEWKSALQDLISSMSNLNISGFKHWMAHGGLAGGATAPLALAAGGPVPLLPGADPSRDSVPALLTPGEFVLRRDAVQAVGLAELSRLNALDSSILGSLRQVLAFSDGGPVPGGVLTSSPLGDEPARLGAITLHVGGRDFEARMSHGVARSLSRELARQRKGMIG
jgi:hypothetical protein